LISLETRDNQLTHMSPIQVPIATKERKPKIYTKK